MSTSPVPAPAQQPAPVENKFESFLSNFGKVLQNIANVAVNVAQEEAPVVAPLLPPTIGAQLTSVLSAAAGQVAAADAKYAAIGASDVPFAVKVAEAVAVGGAGVLAIAAQAGLSISTTGLTTFFAAAYQMAGVLNLNNITQTPTA